MSPVCSIFMHGLTLYINNGQSNSHNNKQQVKQPRRTKKVRPWDGQHKALWQKRSGLTQVSLKWMSKQWIIYQKSMTKIGIVAI